MSGMPDGYVTCERCGVRAFKRGSNQKYCVDCSTKADIERKAAWSKRNPPPYDPVRRATENLARRARLEDAGAARTDRGEIAWDASTPVELVWSVRVAVPFTFAFSKNAMWRNVGVGHVILRKESSRARANLAAKIRAAFHGTKIAHNRLWLDILVEKPTQRGDAINVLDLVADAIQDATGLDDRWYSIRRIDWIITKKEPRLFVGIGQEAVGDVIACSYCGQLLPLEAFGANSHNPFGKSRTCRECSRAADTLRRERRRA